MFWRLPHWLIANGLLDLRDERLCVVHDRIPFFLADGYDHHAVGSDAVDEHECAAPAADVVVGDTDAVVAALAKERARDSRIFSRFAAACSRVTLTNPPLSESACHYT